MKLDISEKQYKELLKLAMLGEWMANAIPDEPDKDEEDVVQYLLTLAKDFGFSNYVEYDEESKKYYITEEFENDTNILDIIGDYHEYALWEGLVLEFSRRELVAKYGEEKVEAMSDEERVEKEMPYLKKYEEEFREFGLDNLEIKKPAKAKSAKSKK